VREAAFEVLGDELPYAVAAEVEEFRESRKPVYIRVTLYVERESQKGMVIGSGGRTVKILGETARGKIETLLGSKVYLDLWVKVLPKWRTSPLALRQLGFPTPIGRNR
jgi:GTP-binding protein Era